MNLKFKTNLLFTKSLNLYLKAYSSVKFYFAIIFVKLDVKDITTVLFRPVCFKEIQTGKVCRVALVDKFSVVLTIILAVVFLGERLNYKEILAICLIISGVVLLIFK